MIRCTLIIILNSLLLSYAHGAPISLKGNLFIHEELSISSNGDEAIFYFEDEPGLNENEDAPSYSIDLLNVEAYEESCSTSALQKIKDLNSNPINDTQLSNLIQTYKALFPPEAQTILPWDITLIAQADQRTYGVELDGTRRFKPLRHLTLHGVKLSLGRNFLDEDPEVVLAGNLVQSFSWNPSKCGDHIDDLFTDLKNELIQRIRWKQETNHLRRLRKKADQNSDRFHQSTFGPLILKVEE